MVPTKIPELNREQTRQLIKDLNHKPTDKEAKFWKNAIEIAKQIKVK